MDSYTMKKKGAQDEVIPASYTKEQLAAAEAFKTSIRKRKDVSS